MVRRNASAFSTQSLTTPLPSVCLREHSIQDCGEVHCAHGHAALRSWPRGTALMATRRGALRSWPRGEVHCAHGHAALWAGTGGTGSTRPRASRAYIFSPRSFRWASVITLSMYVNEHSTGEERQKLHLSSDY